MIVKIASRNNVKVNAVKEVIVNYDFLSNAVVISEDISSDVSKQPKSLDETIKGAINRARKCFKDCDLSFGIEDGLMEVSSAKTNFMNICCCVIYDGKEFYIGLSSAFEYPKKVIKLVFEEGLNINQAFYRVGLTKNPKVGASEGAIGILTKGRLPRKEYTKQAITMALIHLENLNL